MVKGIGVVGTVVLLAGFALGLVPVSVEGVSCGSPILPKTGPTTTDSFLDPMIQCHIKRGERETIIAVVMTVGGTSALGSALGLIATRRARRSMLAGY